MQVAVCLLRRETCVLDLCVCLATASRHALLAHSSTTVCLLRRETCVLDLCVPETARRRLQQTPGCAYSAQLTCDFTSGKATCDTRGLVKLGEKYTVRRFASRLLSGWPPQRGPRATPWPLTACWATMPLKPTDLGGGVAACVPGSCEGLASRMRSCGPSLSSGTSLLRSFVPRGRLPLPRPIQANPSVLLTSTFRSRPRQPRARAPAPARPSCPPSSTK